MIDLLLIDAVVCDEDFISAIVGDHDASRARLGLPSFQSATSHSIYPDHWADDGP